MPAPTSRSSSACSYTATSRPAARSASAAVSPPMPVPTTMACIGGGGSASGGGVRLLEVLVREPVQGRAAHEDLRRCLAGHRLEQIARDVGEIGVEVRVVGRDAHPVG